MNIIEPDGALLDRLNSDPEIRSLDLTSLAERYAEVSERFHSHFSVDQAYQCENAIFHRIRYLELLSRRWTGRVLDVGNDKPFLTYFLRIFNPDAQFEVISNRIPQTPFPLYDVDIEMEAFPFLPETFDQVLFTEVVEHLWRNPSWCVAEMNRVLKTGGSAFVTTPNPCDRHSLVCVLWQANPNQRSGYYPTLELGHLHLWTVQLVSNLFQSHGFEIASATTRNIYGHTKPDAHIEEIITRLSPFKELMNEAVVLDVRKLYSVDGPSYPVEIYPDRAPVRFEGAMVGFASAAHSKKIKEKTMRYVLFFQPRSGSTLMCSRLDSQDRKVVNGFEIIDAVEARRGDLVTDAECADFGPAVKKVVVDRFFAFNESVGTVGFKVAPYQISDDLTGFVQHIGGIVDRQIFLVRDNPVQTALSQLWSIERARQGNPARIVDGEEDTVAPSHIDRAEFEYYVIDSILERERVLALAQLASDPLIVSYELMCSDAESVFAGIKQFLDLPSDFALPKTNLVKVRSGDLTRHVANIDEVASWVRSMGLDLALLEDELARPRTALRHLTIPPRQQRLGGPVSGEERQNGANGFLGKQILQLREALDASDKSREATEREAQQVIHDFSERAEIAERYNTSLIEQVNALESAHAAAQQAWDISARTSAAYASELEQRAARAEEYNVSLEREIDTLRQKTEAAWRSSGGAQA